VPEPSEGSAKAHVHAKFTLLIRFCSRTVPRDFAVTVTRNRNANTDRTQDPSRSETPVQRGGKVVARPPSITHQLLRLLERDGSVKTTGIRPIARELQAQGLVVLNKAQTSVCITKVGQYAIEKHVKLDPKLLTSLNRLESLHDQVAEKPRQLQAQSKGRPK